MVTKIHFIRYVIVFVSFIISAVNTYAVKDTIKSSKFSFIENKNQWDSNILYKADIDGGALFLEKNLITFAFIDAEALHDLLGFKYLPAEERNIRSVPSNVINCHSYKMHFAGASPDVKVDAIRPYPDFNNYFLGNDESRWASNVKKYQEVYYTGIYEGINLKIYEQDYLLKYDFIVSPGADPDQIQLEYEGVNDISLIEGNLVIKTSVNRVIEVKPFAYQEIDGVKKKIECVFKLRGNIVTFILKEKYNTDYELIIDPVLIFSSYSGSTADNWGYTATYDSKGFLYAGGSAFNIGYPVTPGAYQTSYGGNSCDIAISKYDTSGTFMIYSTLLGGNGTDVANSLIVDSYDQLFVLGTTSSTNYPVSAFAFDQTFNGGSNYTLTYVLNYSGSDIVVTKFNNNGTALLASTYLGGSANDGLNMQTPLKYNYADDVRGEIIIDDNNNIYIASTTASSNFPVTSGCFQPSHAGGIQDGVVVKMDNSLTTVIWASYLGGSGNDAVYSILVDPNEDIYVAGGTTSFDFPLTSGVLNASYQGGSADGYITHIGQNGDIILHSTYWGSSAYDQTYFVENDIHNNIFVLGQTGASGMTFINNAAWYTSGGGQFISKMNFSLDTLIWSTAFGTGNGGPDISPTAFLVDLCDKIYLSGWGGNNINGWGGTSGMPITGGAFQSTTDNNDYYFMVMEDDASAIYYGTFFGGSSAEHVDGGTSRFDRKGKIYQSVCAGCGGYDDFPTTPGAVSNTNNSWNCNNGVIKFDFLLPLIVADFTLPPIVCAPSPYTFDNTSYTGGTGLTCWWDFGDGDTSVLFEPSHVYAQSGTYMVTLAVSDTGTCNIADTITKPITIISNTSDTIQTESICVGDNIQIGLPPNGDPGISYQWTPAGTLSDPNISNPIATPSQTTIYTLLVSNGTCTDTLSQVVNVLNLNASAGPDVTTCTGTIQLTTVSSGGATQFIWSSNPQFTDTLNTNLQDSTYIANISALTTFYIQVSNALCTAVDSITVDFALLANTPLAQAVSCNDYCDGVAIVSISDGAPPFIFSWDNGMTNDTITSLCPGDYTVTITDSNSCINIQTVHIAEPTAISAYITAEDMPCEDVCQGTAMIIASGSTPPYSYLWSNGETTNSITDLCEGQYIVTITDSKNCTTSDTANIIVDNIFNNMTIWAERDTIFKDEDVGLHATNLPNCTYNWIPATTITNNGYANVIASPDETTTYYVTTNHSSGCIYYDTITIYVIDIKCEEPYIYIPNAFTPNGDNNNDVLYLRTYQDEKIYLAVFDRWGEKVFETFDKNSGWDGTFRGKECDPGVFVYYLEVICQNDQMFIKKGNVTIIR